jgi:hypothetical protein
MVCSLLDVGEGFGAVIGNGDCLVVHVKPIVCGSYVGPQKLGIKGFSVDKGSKDVEVVFSSIEPNKDCSINCSQGDDN